MTRTMLTLALICLSSFLLAQEKLPIYKYSTDSVAYSKLQQLINDEFKEDIEPDNKKVDSLFERQREIRARILGYRYLFKPSYTLSDELNADNIDTIKTLSVVGKSAIPAMVYQCKNLLTLELVNTKIKKLPRNLKTLTRLTDIRVYTNTIKQHLRLGRNTTITKFTICSTNIPKKFSSYKSLDTLDLAKNNLNKFPNIKNCKKLNTLSLRENNLTLHDLPIHLKTNIESLELQFNKIKIVPSTIGNFKNLKKVNLNYNEIESIDVGFALLKNLEQLGLYQNNLTTVPDALYLLPSLKEIDFYFNQIKRLDRRISNWKNLEVLYLANNILLSVPDNIGELISLRELYLHHNSINTLPESIGALKNLTVLRINKNHLNILPESILNVSNIETLDLAGNFLQTLPIEVFQFNNLKILSLYDNPWDDSTQEMIHTQAEILKAKGVSIKYDEPITQTTNE